MYVQLSIDCSIKSMAFEYSVTLKLVLCVLFLFDQSHMVIVASLSLYGFLRWSLQPSEFAL